MYIGFPNFVSPNVMIDILHKYVEPFTHIQNTFSEKINYFTLYCFLLETEKANRRAFIDYLFHQMFLHQKTL
jgi:hypothetical protein